MNITRNLAVRVTVRWVCEVRAWRRNLVVEFRLQFAQTKFLWRRSRRQPLKSHSRVSVQDDPEPSGAPNILCESSSGINYSSGTLELSLFRPRCPFSELSNDVFDVPFVLTSA